METNVMGLLLGIETNVAGLPWRWNKIVWDSRGSVALVGHMQQKIVCKLLSYVSSDFTSINCIIIC